MENCFTRDIALILMIETERRKRGTAAHVQSFNPFKRIPAHNMMCYLFLLISNTFFDMIFVCSKRKGVSGAPLHTCNPLTLLSGSPLTT